MSKEQTKKTTKNVFILAIVGVVLYKVVVDLIWPLIAS